MQLCLRCFRHCCEPCLPARPANDNPPPPVNDNEPGRRPIIVPAARQLRCIELYQSLAFRTVECGLPRRRFGEWLADVIFFYPDLEAIHRPDGAKFPVPDTLIDDAFNDGSFRWMSDFKKAATVRPKQRPQWRIVPRLRVIWLAFRIFDGA